ESTPLLLYFLRWLHRTPPFEGPPPGTERVRGKLRRTALGIPCLRLCPRAASGWNSEASFHHPKERGGAARAANDSCHPSPLLFDASSWSDIRNGRITPNDRFASSVL